MLDVGQEEIIFIFKKSGKKNEKVQGKETPQTTYWASLFTFLNNPRVYQLMLENYS